MENIQIIASISAAVCTFFIIKGFSAWRTLFAPKIFARLALPQRIIQFSLPEPHRYGLWLHGQAGTAVPGDFMPRISSVATGVDCDLEETDFILNFSSPKQVAYCASTFNIKSPGDYRLELGGNTAGIRMVSIRKSDKSKKLTAAAVYALVSIPAVIGLVFSMIFLLNPHIFSK